ncbi:MAG: tRNA (adenosine(37)-N6)-dimethylallyltransferase MiaA [Cytophagales bacterium]|nr:tRNA (adenosine(37)-N6)-dimethylallyltransferase MiaA [Cytophagales bacterium]
MKHVNLITVTGPTAGGKTAFAAHLAQMLDGEIISADSRQVYKDMNIGTGKDYEDYIVHGIKIPYHLIDIKEAGYKYSVYEFQQDFIKVFEEISGRNKMPILAGGTGLYIDAVTKGYKLVKVPTNITLRIGLEKKELPELVAMLKSLKPELHNTTDITNKKRTIRAIEIAAYNQGHDHVDTYFPKIDPLILGVKYDRVSRRKKISARLHARLNSGLIEEVEELLKKLTSEDLIFYGLEYKYITQYLIGALTKKEMTEKLEIAIHQFAKRQMTWFRKMEREGAKIYWIDGHMPMDEKLSRARMILNKYNIVFNY